MESIIRNKLIIQSDDQINDIAKFCGAMENGAPKPISFAKISPKPTDLIADSKEEDDWLLHNWGTRVKALNPCWISDTEIIFDTYWNPAIPIFLKIVNSFPNAKLTFKFACKTTGYKTGKIEAVNGKFVSFNRFEDYSNEAYETAFELMPHQFMLYTFNQKTKNYEYDTSDFKAELAKKGYYKDTDGSVLIDCDDKQKPLFDSINDLPF